MLAGQTQPHVSFHTPGHKVGGWDITELSYSDNLSCPTGCIAAAEGDIADILGAAKSFILTDGSTCGVLSMLHAAKAAGVKKIAVCEDSHKSVFNGCALLGITPLVYPQRRVHKIPKGHTVSALKELFGEILAEADGLFLTSPDYYGNIADLAAARAYCDETGKLLLVDGAHGGHLHFDGDLYAGTYADLWVDGVHKSLPALTQGAVVSAHTAELGEKLRLALDIFRTTSPSYPVMASVEYAVKYPRNERLERRVKAFASGCKRVYCGGDWTKLCALFGDHAFAAQRDMQSAGLYCEFCDGNVVTFYLSPATQEEDFERLTERLSALFEKYPYEEDKADAEKDGNRDASPLFLPKSGEREWVDTESATGRVCARTCGLFPPCTPLIGVGETISAKKIALLKNADNVFGLRGNKIEVWKENEGRKGMSKGKFITFEGCDGCGKSTQLKLLSEYLTREQVPHIFTREPGGGKISEAIREILLSGKNAEMSDECEALLYAAARMQHLADRVAPALQEGKLVVCDRYVDSSLAYQAYARGLGVEFVEQINAQALKKYPPDVTIFIDLTPAEAFRRKHGADENDRLEQAGMPFHERVYAGYKALADKYPDRIVMVDGRQTPQEIFADVLKILREKGCL